MAGEVELIVEQHDGSFAKHAFHNVPVAHRSLIAVISAGSQRSRELAVELATEIEAALMGAVPGVERSAAAPSTPSEIDVSADRELCKLLVLVGADDVSFTHTSWQTRWISDADRAHVMLVLPPGDYDRNFDGTIQPDHPLRKVNAPSWRDRVDEALPAILGMAEVTSLESRIFISYRRVETLPLALQLFDRLSRERYEVFLDRFTIPPGFDFQRRLTQELADKSMVLLLESKHLQDSEWTQHEIDFAKRNRLGLYALRMPDVSDADALSSLTVDARHPLRREDFDKADVRRDLGESTVQVWQELKETVLETVVAEVKKAHAAALFRRRHRLRADLVAALAGEPHVSTRYSAVGPLAVDCNGEGHLLWPVTRPPDVHDFRLLYGTHRSLSPRSAQSRAIIVGPRAALEPDRLDQLTWLSEVSTCLCFDEGDLAGFARRLATGTWS